MSTGKITSFPVESRSGFRSVLSQRAFCVPYAAETVSIAGDQLARVALSVLVFDRTGSAWLTAATYALTFLPAILGGWLLGWVGDRFSRRTVMVSADAFRAVVFLLMVIGDLPIGVLMALLAVAVLVGPVFSSALVGYLAGNLDPAAFRVGTGLRMTTNQLAQVGGFAVAGFLIAAIHPRPALAVDAATFAASAVLVRLLLPGDARPSASTQSARTPEALDRPATNASLWRDSVLRQIALFSCLIGVFVVPEGLAVPYGHETGVSTTVVGLLLGSLPLGGAVGSMVVVTLGRRWRGLTPVAWMAFGCGLPLLVTALEPPWPVTAVAWFLSGGLAAYQVEVISTLMRWVQDGDRSRVIAKVSALLLASQGLGIAAFGGVASGVGASASIAAAGATGTVIAAVTLLRSAVKQVRRRNGAQHSTVVELPTPV